MIYYQKKDNNYFKGKLEVFFETSLESVIWSLYFDGKENYKALYTIYNKDFKKNVIKLIKFSKKTTKLLRKDK